MDKIALVTQIEYDTDDEDVSLPDMLNILVPNASDMEIEEIEEYVSDEISNITGFCHFGYAMDMFSPDLLING